MKDFFISYNSADKTWAEWIAWQLEEASYTTVIQAWDFLPGENFVLRMHEAARETHTTIIALSQSYLDAEFTHPEWAAAFVDDPRGKTRKLIPVRIAGCQPDGLLRSIVYIDLVGLKETEAKQSLLSGIKAERIKPSTSPIFPGEVHRVVIAEPDFPGMKRSAIKGLRPFEFEDAELFLRLQREQTLIECVAAITHREFRLGILFGESGCGKSSFLQAGLVPTLAQHSVTHHPVYVKFTNLDPFASMQQALIEHTALSKDNIPSNDLLAILERAGRVQNQTLVLLFDQFEQFFVHHQRPEQRQAFVMALADWYKNTGALPVKILFSVRHDFYAYHYELQETMGYSLGPQDSFHLKKFTPKQATEIFAVIAESADLTLDRRFVEEMTEQELASPEDGLISPVDIQILSWVITGHKDEGQKSGFTRAAYQKMGGIEGLLENYLSSALNAIPQESQKQVVLKVMLALIDLERNVRAGVLTTEQIQQKLSKDVTADEIQRAVTWLAQNKVRLITPVRRDETHGYELAHERLIQPLRRLTNKELSEVDQANMLLERRVNEWLGNGRDDRYLLNRRELRQIKKQESYVSWGKRGKHKRILIEQSQRKLRRRLGLQFVPLVVGFLVLTYYGWLQSPWGQIYLVKKDLRSLCNKSIDYSSLKAAAVAFSQVDDIDQSMEIVEEIKNVEIKTSALQDVVMTLIRGCEHKKNLSLCERALNMAESIGEAEAKAKTLYEIVSAMTRMSDSTESTTLLGNSLQIAEVITDEKIKAASLQEIAAILSKMKDIPTAVLMFERIIHLTSAIEDDDTKSFALQEMVADFMHMDDTKVIIPLYKLACQAAETIKKDLDRTNTLKAIAVMAGNRGTTEDDSVFTNLAFQIIRSIDNTQHKASALKSIAEAAEKIDNSQRNTTLIDRILQVEETINDAEQKASVLQAIARVIANKGDIKRALEIIDEAILAVETIKQPITRRASAYWDIVAAIAELARIRKDRIILEKALQIANTIELDEYKASAYWYIAATVMDMWEATRDTTLTQYALHLAGTIDNAEYKAGALWAIAMSVVKVDDIEKALMLFKQAVQHANKIAAPESKAASLQAIVAAMTSMAEEKTNLVLLDKAFQFARTIEYPDHRASALWNIAASAAGVGRTTHDVAFINLALQITESIDQDDYKAGSVLVIAAEIAGHGKLNPSLLVNHMAMINQLLQIVEKIQDADDRAASTQAIAAATTRIAKAKQDKALFEKALQIVTIIDDSVRKASALKSFATSVAKMNNSEDASELLNQSIRLAELTSSPHSKAILLEAVVPAAAQIDNLGMAMVLIDKILQMTDTIESASDKALLLKAVSAAVEQIGEKSNNATIFQRVFQIAQTIDDANIQAEAFQAISESCAKADNWRQAREIANMITSDDAKTRALSKVLTVWAKRI